MKTLFIAWQDPESHDCFPIGRLQFDGEHYIFVYTKAAKEASYSTNFKPFLSFPLLNKEYKSTRIFPFFSNRLISKSRPDYKDYISWLNLSPEEITDPMVIFLRSGGHKATDFYEFFPHPKPDENGLYVIHFFARNLRNPQEELPLHIHGLAINQELHFLQDVSRPKSFILLTEDNFFVGDCPPYFVDLIEDIRSAVKLSEKGAYRIKVVVERFNPAPAPLQFRLLCRMTVKCFPNFRPFATHAYQPIKNSTTPDKVDDLAPIL